MTSFNHFLIVGLTALFTNLELFRLEIANLCEIFVHSV